MKVFSFTIENEKEHHLCGCGHSNGYIAVPKDHPWYGSDDEIQVYVHGGITFSNQMNDSIREKAIGETPDTNDYWILGFDTCHIGDDEISCNLEYVLSELESLKHQALEQI